jgi:hypothetical protein
MAVNLVKLYNDALADAKKQLGKDGELPKPRVDLMKTMEESAKLLDGFHDAKDALEKRIPDLEASFTKVKAAAKQYGNLVDGSAFGLDPKDAKQKKIIADVAKTILDALGEIEDQIDVGAGRLDKLDRILANTARLDS